VTRYAVGLVLVMGLGVALLARADEEDPPPVRRVDPAAAKLVERARKLLHSPHRAGLASLSCAVTLAHPKFPASVPFSVTFEAPETFSVKAVLSPDQESRRGVLEARYARLVETYVARPCRGAMAGAWADAEEYHLEMKKGTTDTVVMSGLAEERKDESIVTAFGKDGLPATVVITDARGKRTLKPRYAKKDAEYVETSRTLTVRDMAVEVETKHARISGYWLPTKIEFRMPSGDLTITVTGHVVESRTAAPRTRAGEQLEPVGWEDLADQLSAEAAERRAS